MARRTIRIIALTLGTFLMLTVPMLGQLAAQTVVGSDLMQLNVKNVSVQEVLKLIAESGGFNIAIGNGIKGSVTLFVDDMAPADLLDVVIGVIDAAYVEENGAIWVMTKEAYQNRYGDKFVDNLVSRTFVLKKASVKEIIPSLKSLLGDKAIIKPDLARNAVRIKASPKQVIEAAQMLKAIDMPSITRSYQLNSMPAEMAAGLLGKMVTDQTSIVEDKINQRLIVSSSKFELDRVDEILGMLDAGGGIESAVFEIKYAQTDTLAEAMRSHLTQDVGVLYSDPRAHKMVVMDYPPVLANISLLIKEFDVPLRQVLIDAKILQVMTSNEVRSGINWTAIQDKVNLSGTFPELTVTDPGLRGDFGDLSSNDYQVIIEALETYGETKLLSSPRLMVVDGGTGMIHVGSQVPYTTIDTRQDASGTLNQFESVVIVDVGVKLGVDVAIKGDGMIRLRVSPEVSSVVGYSDDDIPIVDAATIESSLIIEDGNTVILGGLIKDEKRSVRKGVPILMNIPIIKYLFSSSSEETMKSELVILLTPRVMTGRELYEGIGSE